MYLKKIAFAILVSIYCFSLFSCVSYNNVGYLKDIDSNQVKLVAAEYKPALIQKNDILGIYITSQGEEASALFGTKTIEADGQITATSNGFLVDQEGYVFLPTIGKIKALGLNTAQFRDSIFKKVAFYIKEPTVAIRILNFKVSVNGDVARAGVFNIPNGKVNVIEALTMAGDLNISGRRDNILVLRSDENGYMTAGRVNLRSKETLNSPFFYLKNNDLIYVEPDVKKLNRDNNIYRNVTLFTGILTAVALIYSRVSR